MTASILAKIKEAVDNLQSLVPIFGHFFQGLEIVINQFRHS